MERLRALWTELQSRFGQLSERERKLVTGAGAGAYLLAILVLWFSFSSAAAGIRRRTEGKLKKLAEAQALAASYHEAEQSRQNLERQLGASSVSLISYIEEKGTAAGISIPSMSPKGDAPMGEGSIVESAVEVMLPDITITKLVNFLTAVERGPNLVKVKYLRIEPKLSNQTLTAWATISTYRMKQ